MKVRIIACCKNEEDMLPFFLQYYSSVADLIVIYDGGSTDNSKEIIKGCPKALLIEQNNEQMDERVLTGIRNEAYKYERTLWDWQIIVDIDEFIYHKNLRAKLDEYSNMPIRVTLPKIIGYDMYSLEFPKFDPNKMIVDIIRTGKRNDQWQSKRLVFDPARVNINYEFGCHRCHPNGGVVESENADIMLLHYNYIGYDHFIKRHKYNAARMSEFNKQNNLAYHIPLFSKMPREEFERKVKDETESIVFN
jgi:glycosyltransferase involved in cell wall biosynthesis